MDDNLSFKKNDLSVVLCGQAGQGIQTVEYLLTRIFKLADYNVFATKEYMSRIRGGTNSTEIRISSRSVRASVSRIDILIPLDQGAIRHVEKRISPQTIILAEKKGIGDDFDQTRHKFIDVPFCKESSTDVEDNLKFKVENVKRVSSHSTTFVSLQGYLRTMVFCMYLLILRRAGLR